MPKTNRSRVASREDIETAYWQTRKGEFIKIAFAAESFAALSALARSNEDNWEAVTSREIVTQCFDQLGNYRASAELGTPGVGDKQLQLLKRDLAKVHLSDEALALCQARAGMVLQCAIVQIRLDEHGVDRQIALRLMDDSIGELKAYQERTGQTIQILHWFIFWRGRFHSTRGLVPEATRDFQEALYLADQNLEAKLIRDADKPMKRAQQISAANYTISAILGFGMAHVKQQETDYEGSLPYLDVAILTARCNEDYYRLGYIHYLKGVALRSRSQREIKEEDPAEARRQLQIAYALFGGRDPKLLNQIQGYQKPVPTDRNAIPEHHLHLARTLHQLSLLSLNSAGSEAAANLRVAREFNEAALNHSDDKDCENHRDPRLDYGIRVVRSLIATGLGDYGSAEVDAKLAIEMHTTRRIPGWMQGGAHVAMGRALTGAKEQLNRETVEVAAKAFAGAFDRATRPTERAAAHLYLCLSYSEIGDDYMAGVEYDQALPLIERSEHGWVKRLAEAAAKKLAENTAPIVRVDLQSLMKEGTNAWKDLSKKTLHKLRGQVLRLHSKELDEPGGVERVAKKLGVSQVAIYSWQKEMRHRRPETNN